LHTTVWNFVGEIHVDREEKLQILLTNDDDKGSPGLRAAAEALSEIGYVWVAAPRNQASATGQSMPITSDGLIREKRMGINGIEVIDVGVTGEYTYSGARQ
jgi:5'/3'-nucleotidase SurE